MKKKEKFLVKKQKGAARIYSADGKTEYVYLNQLQNKKIIRIFVHEPICDGVLAEGMDCSNMEEAILKTIEKIRLISKLRRCL